jgi:hypothetical protein
MPSHHDHESVISGTDRSGEVNGPRLRTFSTSSSTSPSDALSDLEGTRDERLHWDLDGDLDDRLFCCLITC